MKSKKVYAFKFLWPKQVATPLPFLQHYLSSTYYAKALTGLENTHVRYNLKFCGYNFSTKNVLLFYYGIVQCDQVGVMRFFVVTKSVKFLYTALLNIFVYPVTCIITDLSENLGDNPYMPVNGQYHSDHQHDRHRLEPGVQVQQ